jgi:8-amino-7-oxononanoate synthase
MTLLPDETGTLDDVLSSEWERWHARGLGRSPNPAWGRRGAEVETSSGSAIDFSSNDYLGLATDIRVVAAARETLPTEGVGATASRLIAGTHREHESLESDIANFFGSGAAVTFATGYSANTGVIPALVDPRDAIFADSLNHASVIDGCRLSRAQMFVFPHANTAELAKLLQAKRPAARRALIVTDGLFSMDGDLAPLREISSLAREFNAWTYVDDAHAVGVLGPRGRGTADAMGLESPVDVTVGTLGKAFGVAGAFVYGSAILKRHLVNHARSFVFSTAPLPAQAAAAREALRIVANEPELRARLRTNAGLVRQGLERGGIAALGATDSHVVPVLIGDSAQTVRIGAELRKRGVLVGAVRPPTVAEGTARLRISVSAAHTLEQIRRLVENVADVIASTSA